MLQNQIDQQIRHNQVGQGRKGRFTIPNVQGQGTYTGYSCPVAGDNYTDVSENPGEYQNKVGQPDERIFTHEQRRRVADQHEHPYECENSPWRRQQSASIGQGNSTYTNR